MEYHFKKYFAPTLGHLQRHLWDSKVPGSVFDKRFQSPRQIADYAYDLIKDRYAGQRLEITLSCREIIGEEGIIALKDLPLQTCYKRERRLQKEKGVQVRSPGYTVLVVHGIVRKPTNLITILAEPLPGKERIHVFSAIYPGARAPDFSNKAYWSTHALIGVGS